MAVASLSTLCLFCTVISTSGDKTVGFPTWLSSEYWNADCTSEGVPRWIKGTLVRHQCGAFGEPKGSSRRSISHLFDCVGMMNAFKFDNGRVTFSSRYFNSQGYRSWSPSARSRNEPTRVNWNTLFTPIDVAFQGGSARSRPIASASSTPSGGVWYANDPGCTLQAYSDGTSTFRVRLRNGQLEELTEQNDWEKDATNSNFPSDTILLHHSTHAGHDTEGNLWGSVLRARRRSDTLYDIDRMVYKVENATMKRSSFGGILTVSVDLRNCRENAIDRWPYPNTEPIGYVSEVVPLDSYVVLIESPFVFNPCALAQNSPRPLLSTWFKWRGAQVPLKFHVLSKQDLRLKRTVHARVPSPFVARIVNAVEKSPQEGGYIVIDTLTHPDEKFLIQYYNVEYLSLLEKDWPADAVLRRYAIDATSGGVVEYSHEKFLPIGTPPVLSSEFVAINEARRGRGYSYVYMLMEPFQDGSAIWKVNLHNRNEPILRWASESGVYPAGAPTLVPRSQTGREDDGVLLVPAFNSNTRKGFILILDAATMNRIGHAEAPDLITFGTYSTFVETCCGKEISAVNTLIIILSLFVCN